MGTIVFFLNFQKNKRSEQNKVEVCNLICLDENLNRGNLNEKLKKMFDDEEQSDADFEFEKILDVIEYEKKKDSSKRRRI